MTLNSGSGGQQLRGLLSWHRRTWGRRPFGGEWRRVREGLESMIQARYTIFVPLLCLLLMVAVIATPAVPAGARGGNPDGGPSRSEGDSEWSSTEVRWNPTTIHGRSQRAYQNRLRMVVARHTAHTIWTIDHRGTLFSAPHGAFNDAWTAIGYSVSARSARWNWFIGGLNGSAQSNNSVTFSSGIPTPWGPVAGQTLVSRCLTTVNGWSSTPTAIRWFP